MQYKLDIKGLTDNEEVTRLVRVTGTLARIIEDHAEVGGIYPIVCVHEPPYSDQLHWIGKKMHSRGWVLSNSSIDILYGVMRRYVDFEEIEISKYDKVTGIAYTKSEYEVELI